MKKRKKVLLVGWGTATSVYVLSECTKLKDYVFYLASTPDIPEEISKLFGNDRVVITNPYDPIRMCQDVENYMRDEDVAFDIVTTFFEMCVYQTAFLAEFLGIEKRLSLNSAIRTSANKYLMRMRLLKSGVDQPKFIKFGKNELRDAFSFFEDLHGPAVIKPIHSGHSYGVRFLETGLDMAEFTELVDSARNDYCKNYDEWMAFEDIDSIEFLMEEFVGGKIYSFDGVVDGNGEVSFIGSTEFELSQPPIMQQIGHTIPIYSLNPELSKLGEGYIRKVIGVLDMKYCGFHGEVKFLNQKPRLIEIAGRLPGGIISNAYQKLSEYNIFDKYLSVFNDNSIETKVRNENHYLSETMRVVFGDREMGVVKNSSGSFRKKMRKYEYSVRSRQEGEVIDERGGQFGVWLYEVVVRSKTLSSEKLVAIREKIISEQKVFIGNKGIIIGMCLGIKSIGGKMKKLFKVFNNYFEK